ALCDGKRDCIDIANRLNIKAYELENVVQKLLENGLISDEI
ncbi:winged helix-turn-helix domain-containing protein, partial [Campylobacter majalis]